MPAGHYSVCLSSKERQRQDRCGAVDYQDDGKRVDKLKKNRAPSRVFEELSRPRSETFRAVVSLSDQRA